MLDYRQRRTHCRVITAFVNSYYASLQYSHVRAPLLWLLHIRRSRECTLAHAIAIFYDTPLDWQQVPGAPVLGQSVTRCGDGPAVCRHERHRALVFEEEAGNDHGPDKGETGEQCCGDEVRSASRHVEELSVVPQQRLAQQEV